MRKKPDAISDELEKWIGLWLSFRLTQCHPRILAWQGEEETRARLETSIYGELTRLGDDEIQRKYAAACPVEGASPGEYGIRFLELEGVGSLLAGIHFYGGDLARPFVHVSAFDFELNAGRVRLLESLIRREFSVFGPVQFRIWVDSEDSPAAGIPGAELDQWFLAGALRDIHKSELPANSSRISLVADPALDSYSAFEKCYGDYLAENPGMEGWLAPADRKLMEASAKEGKNYRVHIDDEPAGWIAGKRDDSGPLSGWQISDELLEPRFRGQGFAPAMQLAFLDTLPAEDLIWGTIDVRNAASLATARRVGREIVCGYLFLPL